MHEPGMDFQFLNKFKQVQYDKPIPEPLMTQLTDK